MEQAREDFAFDDFLTFLRLGGDKVEDVDIAFLADAVDAARALLQARRVPGQVIVNHEAAKLKIDAFARRLCGDANLFRGAEFLLSSLSLVEIHASNLALTTGIRPEFPAGPCRRR